jgi:hypothetical protein
VGSRAGRGRYSDSGNAQDQGARARVVRALVVRGREERALIVLQYLHENVRALDVRLSPEELEKVRTLVQEADVQGDRYPPGFMETLYADTPAWK